MTSGLDTSTSCRRVPVLPCNKSVILSSRLSPPTPARLPSLTGQTRGRPGTDRDRRADAGAAVRTGSRGGIDRLASRYGPQGRPHGPSPSFCLCRAGHRCMVSATPYPGGGPACAEGLFGTRTVCRMPAFPSWSLLTRRSLQCPPKIFLGCCASHAPAAPAAETDCRQALVRVQGSQG